MHTLTLVSYSIIKILSLNNFINLSKNFHKIYTRALLLSLSIQKTFYTEKLNLEELQNTGLQNVLDYYKHFEND